MRARRIVIPPLVIALVVAAGLAVGGVGYYRRYFYDAVQTKGYQPRSVGGVKGDILVINAHEHMKDRKVAWRMLKAMDDLGITKTVICSGATMTTLGSKKVGFKGYDENNQEMLEIARRWPDRFIPFVTINPEDPDNIERLERWFAKGAKGLKLYSGHGDFHHMAVQDGKFVDLTLDDPRLMPVYQWLAEHHVPLLWHVNTRLYTMELRHVLDEAPGLNMNCPHHCMSTSKPEDMVELLRDYPNLYADLSHGFHSFMADALRRVAKNPKAFRAAYDEFPDRFFWGSDTVVTPHSKKGPEWIKGMMRAYFGLFGDAKFSLPVYDDNYNLLRHEELPGLSLPRELLVRFYRTNAERWLAVDAAHDVPRKSGWPAWAADPARVGMGEATERKDWDGLYVAANRLTCSTDGPAEVRRDSAGALRAVLADERLPARTAIRIARGLPGLGCLDDADVGAVLARRGAAMVAETAAAVSTLSQRADFARMQIELAELRG
ncbi:MAG: amidohydrolase family protein, partial [Myxococcota bacterium]